MSEHLLASKVLMVRPADFAYNEQTAGDNEFQNLPLQAHETGLRAQAEFDAAVAALKAHGVEVLVLDAHPVQVPTPDAVFPNNWISTTPEGKLLLYPMYAPNRQAETERLPQVQQLLQQHHLRQASIADYRAGAGQGKVLEGTGSMVLDSAYKTIYASRSVRTSEVLLELVRDEIGYNELVVFDAFSSKGKPFYHTNVVLSIGRGFAVVCSEAIPAEQRKLVLTKLGRERELVEINWQQAEKSFCANVLHLQGRQHAVIAMSESAYNGFSQQQKNQLEKYGELCVLPIPTIEHVGGGSARCMLAEVFLPKS
jgi:hypothetical protein